MNQLFNTQPVPIQKKRVEFFDLAKGFCILLVVIFHITEHYKLEMPASDMLKSMRLPLYFFLSGCFFKTYNGFFGIFLKEKPISY